MGWWEQDEEGHSFAVGSGMMWGDGPADAAGEFIATTRELFRNEGGREPTIAEIRAGLEFSLRGLNGDASAGELDKP